MTDDLERAVTAAALRIETPGRWQAVCAGAGEIARGLSPGDVGALVDGYGRRPDPPPNFRPGQVNRVARECAWELLRRQTIDEAVYRCRERALPALRAAAFDPDHLARGMAFMLLCRLAAEGVERGRFLDDVARALPTTPLEHRALMVDALARQGHASSDAVTGRDPRTDATFDAEARALHALPGYREARDYLRDLGALRPPDQA